MPFLPVFAEELVPHYKEIRPLQSPSLYTDIAKDREQAAEEENKEESPPLTTPTATHLITSPSNEQEKIAKTAQEATEETTTNTPTTSEEKLPWRRTVPTENIPHLEGEKTPEPAPISPEAARIDELERKLQAQEQQSEQKDQREFINRTYPINPREAPTQYRLKDLSYLRNVYQVVTLEDGRKVTIKIDPDLVTHAYATNPDGRKLPVPDGHYELFRDNLYQLEPGNFTLRNDTSILFSVFRGQVINYVPKWAVDAGDYDNFPVR